MERSGVRVAGTWLVAATVASLVNASQAMAHSTNPGKNELRLRARLTAPLGTAGNPKGHAEFRQGQQPGQRRFDVRVEGLTPGRTLDVLVKGVKVGTITVNPGGEGGLTLRDRVEQEPDTFPFPANFPADLKSGDMVQVDVLTGKLVPPEMIGKPGVDDIRLRAILATSPASTAKGKADFAKRSIDGRRRFSVEVQGLHAGDMFDVTVAGVVVGKVTIDSLGIGGLRLDDKVGEPGASPFPSNFPTLTGGELVKVGSLEGTLQPK